MNDRLGELTGAGSGYAEWEATPFEISFEANEAGDGGMSGGGAGGGGGGGFMEAFFEKVNSVKKDIDAVKKVRLHFPRVCYLDAPSAEFILHWKDMIVSLDLSRRVA